MATATKPASLKDIFSTGQIIELSKGQIINIFNDGQLYLLQSGYVKRYLITREGEYAVQSIYGQGQVFPLTSVVKYLYNEDISNEHKTYYYRAVTDVVVLSVPMSTIKNALDEDPTLYRELLLEAAHRLRSNIQQLDNQALRSARWKLAHQLVYLAGQFGKPSGESATITLPLTQSDLAGMLNVSRETVSRTVTGLQNQGYISFNSRRLMIPSVERLMSIYS